MRSTLIGRADRGLDDVVALLPMGVLACLTHWYTSAMFVVPVLAVGGWSWWSSRRGRRGDEQQGPTARA